MEIKKVPYGWFNDDNEEWEEEEEEWELDPEDESMSYEEQQEVSAELEASLSSEDWKLAQAYLEAGMPPSAVKRQIETTKQLMLSPHIDHYHKELLRTGHESLVEGRTDGRILSRDEFINGNPGALGLLRFMHSVGGEALATKFIKKMEGKKGSDAWAYVKENFVTDDEGDEYDKLVAWVRE